MRTNEPRMKIGLKVIIHPDRETMRRIDTLGMTIMIIERPIHRDLGTVKIDMAKIDMEIDYHPKNDLAMMFCERPKCALILRPEAVVLETGAILRIMRANWFRLNMSGPSFVTIGRRPIKSKPEQTLTIVMETHTSAKRMVVNHAEENPMEDVNHAEENLMEDVTLAEENPMDVNLEGLRIDPEENLTDVSHVKEMHTDVRNKTKTKTGEETPMNVNLEKKISRRTGVNPEIKGVLRSTVISTPHHHHHPPPDHHQNSRENNNNIVMIEQNTTMVAQVFLLPNPNRKSQKPSKVHSSLNNPRLNLLCSMMMTRKKKKMRRMVMKTLH